MPFLYHFDTAADVGSISTWCSSAIWEKFYGKFFLYEYIMGLASWMLPCEILVFFLFWRLPRISYFHGRVQPIIIFSQMLWILSIRLIEREINMHLYCSQWQLDAELYNSREKTHWTLEYCIIKFGWNIDLQPKISTQLKRSDCEKKIPDCCKINFACN